MRKRIRPLFVGSVFVSLLAGAGCGLPEPGRGESTEALTGPSVDPGPRGLSANPNTPPVIAGASSSDQSLFNAAIAQFNQAFSVTGTLVTNVKSPPKTFPGSGLGPRWNSFSCRECHGTPFIGGSSFSSNGQAGLATGIGTDYGILAPNQINPPFLNTVGPSLALRQHSFFPNCSSKCAAAMDCPKLSITCLVARTPPIDDLLIFC